MAELWDLYTKNRKPLGRTLERGQPMNSGEYHIVVEIMTVRPSDGTILVTKRHPDKPYGGMWEFTGGSVITGETSRQGAKRELSEETGISVDESQLTYLTTVTRFHQIYDEYLVVTDFTLDQLHLQETEVVDAKFVKLDELIAMHDRREFVEPVFHRVVEHPKYYYKYLKGAGVSIND